MAYHRECPQCGHNEAVYEQNSGRQVCALCMSEAYNPDDKELPYDDNAPVRKAHHGCGDVVGGMGKSCVRKLNCSDRTACENKATTEEPRGAVIHVACHLHQ